MNNINTTEFKNTKSSVASASVEKTLEYETAEGKVKEKSTVDYNVDTGNAIDNLVNTVTESKSVKKAASFLNKAIGLCLSGGGGVFTAAVACEVAEDIFITKEGWGYYVWDVPESMVIGGCILVGIIAFPIIFTIYSNMFIKK